MSRRRVSAKSRAAIREQLAAALDRRCVKHGDGAFHGPHEGFGVIAEEIDELLEAIRSNDRRRVHDEAMDVAVAALWLVASTTERTR